MILIVNGFLVKNLNQNFIYNIHRLNFIYFSPTYADTCTQTWPLSGYSLLRSGAGKPVFLVSRPMISRRSSGLPPLLKLHSYLLPQECCERRSFLPACAPAGVAWM